MSRTKLERINEAFWATDPESEQSLLDFWANCAVILTQPGDAMKQLLDTSANWEDDGGTPTET